jgi:uncharacterized protein (DUF885 family)
VGSGATDFVLDRTADAFLVIGSQRRVENALAQFPNPMKRLLPVSALCFSLYFVSFALCSEKPRNNVPSSAAAFDNLVDRYFDSYFKFHPTDATDAGFHQYDKQLENVSQQAIHAEISDLKVIQSEFGQMQRSDLSELTRGDFDYLENTVKARLLDLETVQPWRKDPDFYTHAVSRSIFLLMKRRFAPPEDRLRSLIAREKQIPEVLQSARQNLSNPPRVFTEVALEQLPDTIEFFRKDVPAAFSEVTDSQLLKQFTAANQGAVTALTSYATFLHEKVLPASTGDFRIGAENFRKKLLYEELVDTPLGRLLEVAYSDLHHNQQALKQVAGQIDPRRPAQDTLAGLEEDHPAPDQLLKKFQDILDSVRQFIEQKRIISIPAGVAPIIEETPPFERALTTASMDSPGVFETKATEALFNVTLPDPSWPTDRVKSWMESFNRGTMTSTAIHEVYPGHFVQFLWWNQAPSKTRKLLYADTNSEGWAHYCEQMMLDEGYGGGDLRLRLGQLQDALLRDARFIVGIEMHTGHMTLDQGKEFFVQQGYQPLATAEVEAERGTSDPTYLVYTLGKLQIMKLREDYRMLQAQEFTLQKFHDEFMRQGPVPLKIVRKAMLGNDSPTL